MMVENEISRSFPSNGEAKLLSASNPQDQPRLLKLLDAHLGGVKYCQFLSDGFPPSRERPDSENSKIHGTVAHQLLANIIPFLSSNHFMSDELLASLVGGLLRIKSYPEYSEIFIDGIAQTITRKIKPLVSQEFELHCEYPIEHQFESGNVLSGSIDLLAKKGDEVRILDFKSSAAACRSANTKNQLMIYGGYMNMKWGGEISVEAVLIG